MGWAAGHIARLKDGETSSAHTANRFEPIDTTTIEVDNIVLCKVKGHDCLHLVKAIQGPRFLIGNNCGGTNGWITANGIYGRCTSVDC